MDVSQALCDLGTRKGIRKLIFSRQCAVTAERRAFDGVFKLVVPGSVYKTGEIEAAEEFIKDTCLSLGLDRDKIVIVAGYGTDTNGPGVQYDDDHGVEYDDGKGVVQIVLGLGLLDSQNGGLGIGVWCVDDRLELEEISNSEVEMERFGVDLRRWKNLSQDPDDAQYDPGESCDSSGDCWDSEDGFEEPSL